MINRRVLLFGGLAAVFAPKESKSERWWRGARPRRYFTVSVNPRHFSKPVTAEERWDKMNEYENALLRFLAVKGIYPKRLDPNAKSP